MAAKTATHGGGAASLCVKVSPPASPKSSPKGGGDAAGPPAHCLCSPTTHAGSFRCRFHRSRSMAWMRRSNSMPTNKSTANVTTAIDATAPPAVDTA